MVRQHYQPGGLNATARVVAALAFAASATFAAPSFGAPRSSGYRNAARSGMNPKPFGSGYGTRPENRMDPSSMDGPYGLLMDAGTVFTLRNAMDSYRPAGPVYTGPVAGGTGSNPVTPAPGAALLAVLGLSMVAFVRRRVGITSPAPESRE